MKRVLLTIIGAGLFVLGIASFSNANSMYLEDFEAPFPAWESGWLGMNTNLTNVYGVGQGRGNNPDGLWIDDGDGVEGSDYVLINFMNNFGTSMTNFEIDIAGWSITNLQVFDINGVLVYNMAVSLTQGAWTDPGVYDHHQVILANGISAFGFTYGGDRQIEGNTSIDNVLLQGGEPIPEPTTMLLLGTGLVGVAGAARRKKKNQA